MSDRDLVSVVVPTYYRNDRLRQCLNSVAEQTYEPVEVIVVDGSGDKHAQLVVDDNVEYVPQKKDEGPHAAREVGARHSNGEYVQFLDDDDQLKPPKIQEQVSLLESSDNLGVAYCGIETEFGDVTLPDPAARGDVLEIALRFDLPPCNTSTMLIRRSVLDPLLPFVNKHGADDIGMKIELARCTEFGFVEAPWVIRGEPSDSLGKSWAAVEGRREILDTDEGLYEKFPKSVRRTALANIHEVTLQRRLEEQFWSLGAILDGYRMVRTAPSPTRKQWGQFLAAPIGKPGYVLLGYLWRVARWNVRPTEFDIA